jgi:hypothetical protein
VKNKEQEKPTCSHCKKKGHEEEKCWKLHPELKSKWAQPIKGKKNTMIIVQDLGSYSEDETKVATMGIKGKYFVSSFSSCTSSAKSKVIPNGRKIKYMFHLQVISKHTKIDTLVDSGSQLNLMSE